MKTYTFHVAGMHCNSCVVLTEENLRGAAGVIQVKADLARHQVTVTSEHDVPTEELMRSLAPLMPEGYALSLEKQTPLRNWNDFAYALPIAIVLIFGFYLLQKADLVGLISGDAANYSTALVVGLIASVSSCLAVVGGLVLSLSASYAKEGSRTRPQVLFHAGRLGGFFLLGGLIGLLGKSFALGATGMAVLGILVGIVMLIQGINLLDVFHFAKRFQLTLPKVFSRHALQNSSATHVLAPLLIGVATFFLPCGFTQSMQVYTLSTGSFLTGGLTMLVFALGTLPMLALLSFSSFSITNKPWKGVFFKTAGLIVIALALFNLINSLVVTGLIDPVFNF
jgi:uncharacterized protein